MSLGYQAFGIHNLKYSSFHFSTFQHLISPRTIIAYKIEKAQLSLDFFDSLRAAKAALLNLVGVAGFEPAASWTRTKRDTKLRHTPKS